MGKTDLWFEVKKLLDLIFPPVCIHCEEETEHRKYPLCRHCLTLLELIRPEHRCPICFQVLKIHHSCDYSIQKSMTFDILSPAATLLYYLKKKHCLGLAPSLAGFMVLQLIQLRWPLPEVVIPLPQAFSQWMGKQDAPNTLLAQALALICHAKMSDGLRFRLDKTCYWKAEEIADKHVLFIDDGSVGQKHLRRSIACIRQGFPKTLKLLSFLTPITSSSG